MVQGSLTLDFGRKQAGNVRANVFFFSFHSDSESIVGFTPDVQAGARGAVAAEQGLD